MMRLVRSTLALLALTTAVTLAIPALPARAEEGHGAKPPAATHGEGEKNEAAGAHHTAGYPSMDLRSLAVQVLGFAILAYIIWRYVKPPVGKILEARREKIRETFDGFDKQDKSLSDAHANAEYGLREVERNAASRLDDATREGAELRDRLIAEGDEYAQRTKARLEQEEELERQFVLLLLRNKMVDFSLRAAEETLRAGVDRPTHDAIVEKFLDELTGTVADAQARAQGEKAGA